MPEEWKILLVMQRDHLSALELGHREERCLEHPSNGVHQSRHEVVQNKFRKVHRQQAYNLVMLVIVFDERRLERTHGDAFREFDQCQLEVRGWAVHPDTG